MGQTDLARDMRAECTGKEQFASKANALKVAKRIGHGLKVYRCRFCDKFHVGGGK